MFKGFYIIWPGDLVFNWVKVILAILIEDHLRIIPVKFGSYWTDSIVGDMMFKGFYIIWPGDLVINWVKVILAILVEDHPRIIPVKFVWYWTNSIVGDDV